MTPAHLRQTLRLCAHTFLTTNLSRQSVVVDLGFNKGHFGTSLHERFGCEVYGVEADSEVYRAVRARPGVKVFHLAIGGADGIVGVKRTPGRCSHLVGRPGDQSVAPSDSVEMMTLERFLSAAGLAARDTLDLVKVDIEGAEVPMFESTSDSLLLRVAQFTVEFHDFLWPELHHRVARIKAHLRSLGFAAINFSRDNTDVLFINRRLVRLGRIDLLHLAYFVKYLEGLKRITRRRLRPNDLQPVLSVTPPR